MTPAHVPPRIAFRCDASEQMGGGHAMRCLTLADELSAAGATVTFVSAAMPAAVAARIEQSGHRLVRIPASPEFRRANGKWEVPPLSDDAQLADADATSAASGHVQWLVVDHYLLNARWHYAARSFADHILVIDDLANRTYDCDVLLDQTFGRSREDYRDRIPEGAKVLTGAAYALLRPDFARERSAALTRRKTEVSVRRVLISMGTMDPGGATSRVVEQVIESAPECAIDVVLGSQATTIDQVRELESRHSGIAVHVDTDRMAELMRDADVAIGGAGTTSWERCCLGLPSIAVVLAENQRLTATNLERAGAVVLAESPGTIASIFRRVSSDQRLRRSMVAAAAAIADGYGAGRVAAAMLARPLDQSHELIVRLARPEDSCLIWLWRNDATTRSFSQTTEPIAWSDHMSWWDKTIGSTDRQLLIAEMEGALVAALRFDETGENECEVSINLAPSARGWGLGRIILAEACKTFRKERPQVNLTATIHRENSASRRIFEKVGFVRDGELSNPAFERYVFSEGAAQ